MGYKGKLIVQQKNDEYVNIFAVILWEDGVIDRINLKSGKEDTIPVYE